MKKLAIGMSALIVAGCAVDHPYGHEHQVFRGVIPAVDATSGVDVVPRSMCSATSYEEDHDRWLSMSTAIRNYVLIGSNPQAHTGHTISSNENGNRNGNRNTERTTPPGPHQHAGDHENYQPNQAIPSRRSPEAYGAHHPGRVPDAVYLVEQFEAELDGSYDAVTQNCRAYNQCMNQNGFDERLCTQSANMWQASQDRFHQLAYSISDIRADVAQACDTCGPDVRVRDRQGRHHPEGRRHPENRDHGRSGHGGGHGSHSGGIGPFSTDGHH